MPVTIQTGAHQFSNGDITKYSLMMGGLNTTHDVLKQYDPLTNGNYRLFMVRKPLWLVKYFGDDSKSKFTAFKHILEYGNLGVSGIQSPSVEFAEVQGGYIGKSFSIPKMASDSTNELTVKVFELSGSPIREILHTWINGVVDLDSGLAHYNGLIAAGEIGYAQANHTCEFIYVMTDRTGMKVEYAAHLTNCFPTSIPSDHFNGDAGTHDIVQYDVAFNCTKHEGIDVNEKAKLLLKNNQIMTNSIEYFSGLSVTDINATKRGYNPLNGKLEDITGNKLAAGTKNEATYRTKLTNSDASATSQSVELNDYQRPTPSYTDIGNRTNA